MPSVIADYQERKRIVFTTRGRSYVNARETLADGPIGFTSTELLLIALGNCSLGTLLNHPILKDQRIFEARAQIDAEMAPNPDRVAKVHWRIVLGVEDEAIVAHIPELERVAISCPTCNSLNAERVATITLITQSIDERLVPWQSSTPDDGASCVVDFSALALEATTT